MTRPLQPGDLCLIIGSKEASDLIGRAVTLKNRCDEYENSWDVKEIPYYKGNLISFHERTLMRIDGHQDTETNEQKEELTV